MCTFLTLLFDQKKILVLETSLVMKLSHHVNCCHSDHDALVIIVTVVSKVLESVLKP